MSCAAEMVFFSKNVSEDLERALLSLIPFLGSSSAAYITIATYCSRHKIIATLDALSQIYAASELSKQYYNFD